MIFLTGDTHGTLDTQKISKRKWKIQKELTKDDYLIILGDFGLYWNKNKTFEYLYDFYQSRNYTVLWLDGNHENHDWIDSLPTVQWHGGLVQKDSNVIHLMRGQCYEIYNNKFFVMGGAMSVDKERRIIGESWWPQEELNYSEQEEAIKNLESSSWSVDYILSHAAPKSILYPMFRRFEYEGKSVTEKFLDFVLNRAAFKHWYFGHYHEDVDYDRFSCLYDRIISLDGEGIERKEDEASLVSHNKS